MNFIYDILLGVILGSANSTYKKSQESDESLPVLKIWLILVFNYCVSVIAGYQLSIFIVQKWSLSDIGFIVAFASSALAANLFQALTKVDWNKMIDKKMGLK